MLDMFKDADGNVSSMRIVWTFAVVVIIGTWSYVSISNGTMQAFTMGDAAWFAALFGGKVGQTYVERMNNKPRDDSQ